MIIGTDLFWAPIPKPLKHKGRPKVKPCIRYFGTGPDGTKCGTCEQHYFRQYAKKYPKCGKRGDTGSASTDHSSWYLACGKYEPKVSPAKTATN
jgi:hypothetical protein